MKKAMNQSKLILILNGLSILSLLFMVILLFIAGNVNRELNTANEDRFNLTYNANRFMHVKQCLCLIFPFIKFLVIVHVLRFAFQIFYIFQCFSRYFKSYSVCFSFSMIFSFFAILQVLQCAFLIFHPFCVPRHI